MRFGVDACCWSNRRGFGRFTRELVERMVVDFPEHELVLIVDAHTAAEGRFPHGARIEVVATRDQPSRAASASSARSPADLWRLARAASRVECGAFFFPAVYSFYPLLSRRPTLVTFHDTIAESHPRLVFTSMRSRLFWGLKLRAALLQAGGILTVSESARTSIAARFRIPRERIWVAREAAAEEFRPIGDRGALTDVLRRHRLPEDEALLLYVGGLSPHKNLSGLLRAVAELRQRRAYHLAIVGDHASDPFNTCYAELLAQRGQLGLEKHVTFTGFVANRELAALYNAARLLVFPSFDEGFGLPAVEAMASGLPVAASHRGSLPEVLGEAAVYFDPARPEEMANAIERVAEDAGLRERLREEGLTRARTFTWSEAARRTVEALKRLAR